MNSEDEQLLRGRVYGHDDPNPGPLPSLLDVTGWRTEEIDDGVTCDFERYVVSRVQHRWSEDRVDS